MLSINYIFLSNKKSDRSHLFYSLHIFSDHPHKKTFLSDIDLNAGSDLKVALDYAEIDLAVNAALIDKIDGIIVI